MNICRTTCACLSLLGLVLFGVGACSGGGRGAAVHAGVDASVDAGSGGAPGDGSSAAPTGRLDLDFDLDWKYQQGNPPGAEAAAFDDSGWTYVDLPHSTKFVTPDDPNAYLGPSWYRKHFTAPGSYAGNKVFIEFGAAMQVADVWINGTHKLQHQGGYAPFTIDVTGDLATGGAANVIAVKLNSNSNPAWAPGWNGVDFQYHGGLYRNVTMHVTSPLHVTDAVYANKVAGGGVFVTYPSVSPTSATVAVATNVLNETSSTKNATLLSEIVDGSGKVVGSSSATSAIAPGQDFDFSQSIVVTNPSLWHPDAPNLYTLRTTVRDGMISVDSYSTRIGIRTIRWNRAAGLTINGRRVKAVGVNMHQEIFGLGNAVPDRAIYYDVKRIKDGGMSFIRGSHYPHAPAFYDACDALGIVVLDAQTGWQQYIDTPAFNANTFQELRDMMRRDRNHPSVVAWEASLNESNYTEAWAQAANAIVHAEYPGNQAYSAAWTWFYADIHSDSSQAGVRTYAGDARPILIDEYGDWDYGAANSTSRQAREAGDGAMLIQAANVLDGTDKNMALPWLSAASYWDYADYAGFSNYGITRCGLVDMYRLPKFAYYFMQSQRDPNLVMAGIDSGPMVYIANLWTPTSPTMVRVYSNCEQVSMSLDGVHVATNAPASGTHLLHPPFDFDLGTFTPGTLQADCLIGGATVATFARQTPGAPASLRLRPEGSTMQADLSDARLVFIDVLDANGTVVPTDASQVTLSVNGPGSVVGPTTVTMKGGQLATWIRAGRQAGTITLQASAPGIASARVDLTSDAVAGLPPAPADRP